MNTGQYRQGMDLPEVVTSSRGHSGAVEQPEVTYYSEVADEDQLLAVHEVDANSCDTELKHPYDHLEQVPQSPVVPSVYLQLIADDAVQLQDAPTTSGACVQKPTAVPISQPLCDGEEPVPDMVQ